MAFNGFSSQLFAFFEALEVTNTKEWFEAHKSDYQTHFVNAALDFCETLAPSLNALDASIDVQPKLNGSLRRIFRDTRFSKDKTPYHTHMHLIFWSGKHPNRAPGLHFVLAKNRFGFGVGHWAFTPEQLARYRQAVLTEAGDRLTKICADLAKAGLDLDAPSLKKIPKSFDPEHKNADWLRHKGVVMRTDITPVPSELMDERAVSYWVEKCAAMLPLLQWLKTELYTQEA